MSKIDNKQEILQLLADDFAKAVKEYRKAINECEINRPMFMSEREEERWDNEYLTRMKSLTTSNDYINLTRKEYWSNILESKIKVIACIGGFKFMQEFDRFLCHHPLQEELDLSRAFDYHADGIGGWCR